VLLKRPRGLQAVDRLTALVVDRSRPEAVRVAALNALAELKPSTLKPLLSALKDDPSPSIVAAMSARVPDPEEPGRWLIDVVASGLPDDPEGLRRALARAGEEVPIATVHDLIEQSCAREQDQRERRRAEWMAVRAAAHVALAKRGSRLALYDLRDTF